MGVVLSCKCPLVKGSWLPPEELTGTPGLCTGCVFCPATAFCPPTPSFLPSLTPTASWKLLGPSSGLSAPQTLPPPPGAMLAGSGHILPLRPGSESLPGARGGPFPGLTTAAGPAELQTVLARDCGCLRDRFISHSNATSACSLLRASVQVGVSWRVAKRRQGQRPASLPPGGDPGGTRPGSQQTGPSVSWVPSQGPSGCCLKPGGTGVEPGGPGSGSSLASLCCVAWEGARASLGLEEMM